MNKILISALLAGSLLLLDSPEAAAHKEARSQHRSPTIRVYDAHDRHSYKREHYWHGVHAARHARDRNMPRWLKRNTSFHHWFDHSHLRRDRHLSWHQLFTVYYREHHDYRYRSY